MTSENKPKFIGLLFYCIILCSECKQIRHKEKLLKSEQLVAKKYMKIE